MFDNIDSLSVALLYRALNTERNTITKFLDEAIAKKNESGIRIFSDQLNRIQDMQFETGYKDEELAQEASKRGENPYGN